MDRNDTISIKEELLNIVSSLQNFLPKRKDIIVFETLKPKLTLNNIHGEAKKVFPQCFVGARLVIFRQIMERVKLIQNYTYGRPNESFKCYSSLMRKELESKKNVDDLMIDTNGSATAIYTQMINRGYEMKLTTRIKDYVSSDCDLSFEKEQENAIGSLTFSLDDVDPNTLNIMTQYLYKINPEISCGTEFNLKPLCYPPKPDLSISARFEKPSFIVSSTVSNAGFQLCLFKQFSSDLRIASVMHEGRKNVPPTISLGLHKSYANGTELKVFVDSQKCGGFTIQKDLYLEEPLEEDRVVRVVWSTVIDRQRRVRFGFGFHLDF